MDKATMTMIENLEKNTGRSLAQWILLVQAQQFEKHGEIMKYLKEVHGLTHGYANLIAHKAKGSDAGSAADTNDLIVNQYRGKEHFKPLYDTLMEAIHAFGSDVEVAPKNTYVSLRRKKQFAILNPASKTRFEIGLNLKGQDPEGILEAEKPNAMCSHKIHIGAPEDINEEVLRWIRTAYDKAC